jgi:fructose-1-phosphate kinase PfkB-like protein
MSREAIARETADALRRASPIASLRALVGLDGFVDEIIGVIDTRHDAIDYTLVPTIDSFAQKLTRAAGQSSNFELHVKQMKLGGNGPIMANALASAGLGVTYVGGLGYPTIHPVFAEFAARARVVSIADPGHTDALEFADGKLMLGKLHPLNDVNWTNLATRFGIDRLVEAFTHSQLIALTNWTMLPFTSDIWRHLLAEVLPNVPSGRRSFFVDLADPEKRTREDLLDAMTLLTRFQQAGLDVILGLNLKESGQVAQVLGIQPPGDPEAAIEATARAIRAKLDLSCVVVHPRRGAAAATAQASATFWGPFTSQPKISTGAGDHFNAGFCLGHVLGLSLEQSLCTGVATSGFYVRQAVSPGLRELIDFIEHLPPPQG